MSNSITIPKIIMQTWKNLEIPAKWSKSPESIKKFLPNWNYVLMTDSDNLSFVEKYFPDFLSFYNNFKYPIQRADAIRYMWLYVNGGVYMDLDFELTKNLEVLINDNKYTYYPQTDIYLVEYTKNGKFAVTNSFMISKPRNPFWLKVIDEMKKDIKWYYKITRFTTVYESTGPSMLTRVYNNMKKQFNIYLINQKNACTTGLKFVTENMLKNSYIKSIELTSGESWHGPLEKILKKIKDNYLLFFIVFIVIIVLRFIL